MKKKLTEKQTPIKAPAGNLANPVDRRQAIRETYDKKANDKYLKSIEEQLKRWLLGQRDIELENRRRQREGARYYHGEMTQFDEMARRMPALRDLKINVIRQNVDFISGMAKARATTGSVALQGVGMYSEPEIRIIREEFNRRLMVVQERTSWRYHRNRAIDSACQNGVGYVHVGVRPEVETGKLGFFCSSPFWENVYADTGKEDIAQGEFVLMVSPTDSAAFIRRHPKLKDIVQNLGEEFIVSKASDEYGDGYHTGSGQSAAAFGGLYERGYPTGDWSRRQIISGTGYYRDTVNIGGMPIDIVLYCRFITNRSFNDVKLIAPPVYLGHSRPPVARLMKAVRNRTNLPYSDMIEDVVGLARTQNALLRNTINLLASRGVVANIENLTDDAADVYLNGIAARLGQTVFVLPEKGEKGSLQVIKMSEDARNLSDIMQTIYGMARSSSNVHPALLGDKTNVESGAAMRRLQREAETAISTFYEKSDHDLTKPITEQMLAAIEQYNGAVDFGSINKGEQVIAMGSDGDSTIEGNRALWAIKQSNRDDMLDEGHQNLIQAMMSRSQGPELLAFYQLYVKALDMPDATELLQDIKSLAMQLGVPVLPSTMSDEEKAQQAQQAQQNQQIQMQQMMLAMQEMMAKIKNLEARSHAAMKKAEEPPDSETLREMRDTIARQSRSLGQSQ